MKNFMHRFAMIAGFAGLAFTAVAQADEAPSVASPRVLTIVDTEAGLVLGDANDLSVYTFDNDTSGVSHCYGSCATAWPPVLTTKDALSAPFGITVRRDGAKQITFNGSPLYLYISDTTPGEITGDGIGGVWHLVHLAP